jgi:hypothetical protein
VRNLLCGHSKGMRSRAARKAMECKEDESNGGGGRARSW